MRELCDVVDELMRDPDLTGDLLLFAVAFAHAVDPDYTGGAEGSWDVRVTERAGFSRDLIASDRPHYMVTPPDDRSCTVIVGHRRCHAEGETAGMLRDPLTGAGTWWSACRRHRRDAERTHARSIDAWNRAGSPMPPPNRGGVLPRHFEQDWPEWYRWAAGEPAPATTVVGERPRLVLVPGGAG